MRIALLTSGGDAPGMNAAIRAATLAGIAAGCEVFGVMRGYRGLLDGSFVPMCATDVAGIARDGGTVLGSSRCRDMLHTDGREQARAVLASRGIEGVVVIGGNGSLAGANALAEHPGGPRVVGVPASIDNDIGHTRASIGADTALNTIVDACDKIADTATAHGRVFLVEVMGRDCGYLANAAAIAVEADAALVPEANLTPHEIIDAVVSTICASTRKRVIIIVAEGVRTHTEELAREVDARLRAMHGPNALETRATVLGHVVRGGRPSAFDRLLGDNLGDAAARAIASGATRVMTAWSPPIDLVDIEAAIHPARTPHPRRPRPTAT